MVASNCPSRFPLVGVFNTNLFTKAGGDGGGREDDFSVVSSFEGSSKALLDFKVNFHLAFDPGKSQYIQFSRENLYGPLTDWDDSE